MKRNIEIPKPTCNKCGKLAPIDTTLSTENWVIYKIKEPCECGGKFCIKFDERTEK